MQKLLLFVSIVALAGANKFHTLPFYKSANHIKSLGNVRAERHHIMNKYNAQVAELESDECVEDLDGMAMAFYGEISIGNPPQTLTALFDTGTSEFFVQNKANFTGNFANGFDTSASTTIYENSVTLHKNITYNNTELIESGSVFEDTVVVAGMTLYDTSFLINTTPLDALEYPVLFGLGINVNNYNKYPSPLEYMVQQGYIEKRMFSFYFNHNNVSSNYNASKIIFGASDPSLYQGEFLYANVIPATNWYIYLDSVTVNGRTMAPKLQAAVDTSYAFIGAPIEAYVRINAQINGTVGEEGIYYVDCNEISNLPDVEFNINGQTLKLSANFYIVQVQDTNGALKCMVSFLFMNTDHWILGQSFVSSFYTEFDQDNSRIGFAYPISN